MIYGYARISTKQQSIDRQVRNIVAAYPDAKIIKETYTGTKFIGRAELEKLMKIVKQGDKIVCDSVSRFSRSADEGCSMYEQCFDSGIDLIFLKEPQINTAVYRDNISRQIDTQIATGSDSTDAFIRSVFDALNAYSIALAKDQIRAAFSQAQKEVDDLHQRTREGMITAKMDGKQIGQQPGRKLNIKKAIKAKEIIRQHCKNFGGTLNDIECMRLASISRNTFYKYKSELIAERR